MNYILDTALNLENSVDVKTMSDILAIVKGASAGIGIVSILIIVEMAFIFKKCGKAPWLAIIPIANTWTLFTIVDLPGWLCLIPIANIVGMVFAYFKLPGKFNKSAILGLGILFLPPIFLALLAFGKDKNEQKSPNIEDKPTPAVPVPGEIAVNPEAVEAPSMDAPAAPAQETGIPDLMAAPTPEELNPGNINVVQEERINMAEEPALNIAEDVTAPVIEAPAAPEIQAVPESTTPSAFDMPAPVQPEIQTPAPAPVAAPETLEVETLDETIVSPEPLVQPAAPEVPVQPAMPEAPVIETPAAPASDNIFETITAGSELLQPAAPVNNEIIEPFTPETPAESLDSTFEMPMMANDVINSDITTTKKCPNCGHENEYSSKTCAMCGTNLE